MSHWPALLATIAFVLVAMIAFAEWSRPPDSMVRQRARWRSRRTVGTFPPDATTVDGVFERLADAFRGADEVDVTYIRRFGYPSRVGVDSDTGSTDDEYGFGIRDFQLLDPAACGTTPDG